MSPPQLATNAPIADVLHPVVVFLGEVLRDNTDAPVAHSLQSWLGQRFHAHVPLIGDNRLHHGLTALTMSHGMSVRFDALECALFTQHLQESLACSSNGHAG